MTTTQAISKLIAEELQRNGGDIRKAFDAVIGEGSYLKLASDLYDALRAKAGL